MIGHAVAIAGGGPTGLMLAGELALAGVDVAIVERRPSPDLVGSRAGGLHSRTIEVFDQRGIADRKVPIYREREVTGFAQDDTGVDVELSNGQSLRAEYLIGCDGGRSVVRNGIEFSGWDPTTSFLIAEVEMAEEPEWGMRNDAIGVHGLSRLAEGGPVRVVLTEQQLGPAKEPTLGDLREALIAFPVYRHGPAGRRLPGRPRAAGRRRRARA